MSGSAHIGNRWTIIIGLVLGMLLVGVGQRLTDAAHESTNVLRFAPPDGTAADGSGEGRIDYQGGEDEASRWTTTFTFTGLQPETRYDVVVQGRFGEDDTPDASAFTSLCSFQTTASGAGVCWSYIRELRRLGIVEVRQSGNDRSTVLSATRAEGPGTIASTPNAFSPSPSPASAVPASPSAPATPVASPAGT
ncbi:MAG: hypothetical protein ACR2LS_07390 [Thermomicrobiales bacterium]